MIDFQNLTNLPEINFKAKGRPELKELADYIDKMKADLFDEHWSQATKKHIKTSLVLYIRSGRGKTLSVILSKRHMRFFLINL